MCELILRTCLIFTCVYYLIINEDTKILSAAVNSTYQVVAINAMLTENKLIIFTESGIHQKSYLHNYDAIILEYNYNRLKPF